MKKIVPATVASLVASVVLLAGCSSPQQGSPEPATTGASDPPSSSSAGSSTTATSAAPKVTNPLNASKFVANPCSSLTASDLPRLQESGAPPTVDNKGAPGCIWNAADASSSTSINWLTPDTNGLSNEYAKRSEDAYFIPTTIDGYPAVYSDTVDLRTSGECTLNVAVNDHLYFLSFYQLNTASDSPANATQSCSLAEQAAADVIKNLQGVQ
ncbi:MAG TPA: DUF3558 domain-containing protein [Pseudonocardiaceae bacterium]|nr:DUF3558 domain-containing protein [Pseudonocardiaceae bacterium]